MANFNTTYAQQVLSGQTPAARGVNGPQIARVTHVVQGPYYVGTTVPDPNYNDPTDLGKITFQWLIGNQDRTSDSNGNLPAKPLHSSMKHIPVEGEFVQIVVGPSLSLNDTRGQIDYYYTPPFDLWGASHHNALPDLGDYSLYVNGTDQTYQESLSTNRATNTATSQSTAYPLGPDFLEKSDIKALKVFTGDVTIEGRWGNSIRFGSTTAGGTNDNYWSKTGSIGSPITILRNGQGPQLDKVPWVPTVENANRDLSLIYLTSNQQIVIDDIQNNFSLTSWQINLESVQTVTIPLQQQLSSFDAISPAEQDNIINNAINPNPTPTPQLTGSITTTPTIQPRNRSNNV